MLETGSTPRSYLASCLLQPILDQQSESSSRLVGTGQAINSYLHILPILAKNGATIKPGVTRQFMEYCYTRGLRHNRETLSLFVLRSTLFELTDNLILSATQSDSDRQTYHTYQRPIFDLNNQFSSLGINIAEQQSLANDAIQKARGIFITTLETERGIRHRSTVIPTKIPNVLLINRLHGTLQTIVYGQI